MNIEIRNLRKSYGTREVLHSVNLTIPSGEITALLGPSGSGKSTLLRLIAGLEGSNSGAIFFDGHDVTHVPVSDRNIGFCFQDYAPFRHMSVFDNVAYGLRVRKLSEQQIAVEVTELLVRMGLASHAKQLPHQLSGGQRQRMALARALAIRPSVLLLDEPFAALDAKIRSEVRQFVRDLQRELGITTILVTHDQNEALEVADSLAVLHDGAVQQAGSPVSIYDRPENEFVRSFIGPTTVFRGTTVRPHQLRVRKRGSGEEAVVTDVVQLGFEVRLSLMSPDGSECWVQASRYDEDISELKVGDDVFLNLRTEIITGGGNVDQLGAAVNRPSVQDA